MTPCTGSQYSTGRLPGHLPRPGAGGEQEPRRPLKPERRGADTPDADIFKLSASNKTASGERSAIKESDGPTCSRSQLQENGAGGTWGPDLCPLIGVLRDTLTPMRSPLMPGKIEGWRGNSRILLHLEKNHVVPPSSQDVALCRYSVSGEVPL